MRTLLAATFVLLSGAAFLALGGCGDGHDHAGHDHPAPAAAPADDAAPYPLKTCLVSGEELGKMGTPHRIVHEGQEILFCCSGCEKDFRKEPAKYMEKVKEAAKR